MPIKPLYLYRLLLTVAVLLAAPAKGQDLPAEETFDQARLAIWCETIYFIYEDYNADSLGQQLDCKNWPAFRESIKPNHLQVYSFFQAIEKPEIYAGYNSNEAKLNKLVEEIGRRLKSSPSRQQNAARRQRVDSLQTALQDLAQKPVVLPGSQTGQLTVQESAAQDQELVREEAAQEEAVQEEAAQQGFPWAELLQWLLIALLLAAVVWLWMENRRLRKNIGIRMARRKQEIAVLAQEKIQAPAPEFQASSASSLSRAEIMQLIRSELAKVQKQQQSRNKERQSRQAAERSSAPIPAQAHPEGQEEPVSTSPSQGVVQEAQSKQASPGIYYDKLPLKGGFHHNQLSAQRHPDSIYSIEVSGQRPDEAEFWVTEDAEIQKYAMENGLSFFEEACEYDQLEEHPSRVNNLERGRLRKQGQLWQIEKKVKVSFE